MNKDLTIAQQDYAHFLPALSGFYATYVGKQRYPDPVDGPYVPDTRMPNNFANGMESLNYLNAKEGAFTYKWTLYSAGHAELDTTKHSPKEDMVRNRDRENTWLLGDSGGFQIGKGVWEGEWKDPNSKFVKDKMADCVARGTEIRTVETSNKDGKVTTKSITVDLVKEYQSRLDMAQKKRDAVLRWMDAYADYGMILDIPAWVSRSPAGALATGISEYQDAVEATKYNNEYWMKHRTGACKFLNVLQGENFDDAEDWYEQMKDYCDPVKYPDNHFNGWSMGGQNMCDVELVLKRIVTCHYDGLLQSGIHDVMHFLGTSKLEWATLLTDVQRAVRKHYNPTFMVTFDCASPFLATANGQVYTSVETPEKGKWTYRMVPSVDELKYATDTRTFKDATTQDGIFKTFEDSPVTDGLLVNDICTYAVGDVNKIGTIKVLKGGVDLDKEGNPLLDADGNTTVRGRDSTSWDSFSYAIQMGHNVWTHINAVQEANRQYDDGNTPKMLLGSKFDQQSIRDMINEVFAQPTKELSLSKIIDYRAYWMQVPGTRGAIGKKTISAKPKFNELFDEVDPEVDDTELDETKLEELQDEQL
jgi:hypothetical protein